jgi:hypothetical protein
VILCRGEKLNEVRTSFGVVREALRGEYQVSEREISIALNPLDGQDIRAVHPEETKKIIEMLVALPHGVSSMSADMPHFVETSNSCDFDAYLLKRAVQHELRFGGVGRTLPTL